MNTRLLTRVRRAYCHSMVSRELGRRNVREWCRAVRVVGDKWLFAKAAP